MIVHLLFIMIVNGIEITLKNASTCFQYQVQDMYASKIFNFHYNHNMADVNMVLYNKNSKEVLSQTGYGINYKHSLTVSYEEDGNYEVCFEKKSTDDVDISFQIVDELDMPNFAGKEQLSKVSRKISQFLMDIKRVGWTFKGVLQQHNERKQKILSQENFFGGLMFLKLIVMCIIIGLQIWAVKKIFD